MSVATAIGPDDSPVFMWGRREYQYAGKYLGTGNRCGHDPQRLAADRLALPPVAGGHRLKVIDSLIEKAHAYFADPASMPLLAYLGGKTNRDGTPRQNRSEGREAHSLILSAILCQTDLASLRVGRPLLGGGFRNASFDEIARTCGLTEPSEDPNLPPVASSRFRRGVEWLKRAGAIEVFEQYEETPDGKRGRPAIKTVSQNFLMVLGRISKLAMKRYRDKAYKRAQQWRNSAVQSGVQVDDEYNEATWQIESARVQKEMFPKPKIKNQMPRTVRAVTGQQALSDEWASYQDMIKAQIMQQHDGVLPRSKAYTDAYRKAGGLQYSDWLSRRERL